MKLKKLIEEMGAVGMAKLQKTLNKAVKESGVNGNFTIKQSEEGRFFEVFKNGKPFATVPFLKVNNLNYMISVVTGEI
jgi:hypothetical protein